MFAALPLVLALAPVSGGDSAQAEAALPELASAFRSICLERIADAPGQLGVASASPWNFAAGARAGTYRRGPISLTIEAPEQTCSVTATVPASETVASVQTALGEIVPLENWQPLPSADSRYVLISLDSDGAQFVISFKISNASGHNLATLMVAKR